MNRVITHYMIASYSEQHHSSIEEQVNNLIQQGWQPIGGISVSGNDVDQALVMYAEDVSND